MRFANSMINVIADILKQMNSKNSVVVVLTIAAVMLVGGMVAMISVSDVDARCNNLGNAPIGSDWECRWRGGPGGNGGDGASGAVNGDNNVDSGNGGDGGNGGNGGDANGGNGDETAETNS